jgi:peptidoglycan/xylan/chitin deacetylase (PgdA/CDA1 family)
MKVPILMYHSVSASAAGGAPGYRLTPRQFEEELVFLRDRKMKTVSLAELSSWREGEASLPAGALVLTFDDGYADNFFNALPLLKKYGFRATFFLTVSTLGGAGMMGRAEVEALLEAGMEVGSHGWRHDLLGGMTAAELSRELESSRRELSRLLRRGIDFFSLPRGYLPPLLPRLARRAGYRGMCTSLVGYNSTGTDPFLWRRFPLRSGVSLSQFISIVTRRGAPLARVYLGEKLRSLLRRRYRYSIFRGHE